MKYSRTLLLHLNAVTIKDHDMSEDVTTDNALGIAIDVSGSCILCLSYLSFYGCKKDCLILYVDNFFNTS